MNEIPSNVKSELKFWYMAISFLKDSKDSIFRNNYLSDHVNTCTYDERNSEFLPHKVVSFTWRENLIM